MQVQGKIDRVDVMEREGRTYLRVVDYKTDVYKRQIPGMFTNDGGNDDAD